MEKKQLQGRGTHHFSNTHFFRAKGDNEGGNTENAEARDQNRNRQADLRNIPYLVVLFVQAQVFGVEVFPLDRELRPMNFKFIFNQGNQIIRSDRIESYVNKWTSPALV